MEMHPVPFGCPFGLTQAPTPLLRPQWAAPVNQEVTNSVFLALVTHLI